MSLVLERETIRRVLPSGSAHGPSHRRRGCRGRVATDRTRMITVRNPNNPTGAPAGRFDVREDSK